MSDIALLASIGAPATRQTKYVPLTTSTFFSGLMTQRSPFNTLDSRYNRRFLGARQDALIDGSNVELSNYATIIRRYGNTLFSNQTLAGTIDSFYSFRQLNGSIDVIVDTSSNIYKLTSTTQTNILTKGGGAGQAYFLGVGNTLYIGDAVEQKAWTDGGSARNWGIAAPANAPALAVSGGTNARVWLGGVNQGADFIFVDPNGNIEISGGGFPNPKLYPNWATIKGQSAGFPVSYSNAGPYATWSAGATYQPGTIIIDSNNNLQQSGTSLGTAGTTVPTWNSSGGSTTDNTVTWTNIGHVGGPLVVRSGYTYCYAYHTSSGHVSTASPTVQAGPVAGSFSLTLTLTGTADTQCDYLWVFRTADGGSTMFFLGQVANPGNSTITFVDNFSDQTLNTLIQAPINRVNDPPPVGLGKMAYHLNRIWGAVNNTLYYSGGPDTLVGSGNEAFPPLNYFIFPTMINKLVPISSGLLVFTTDTVYLIVGTTTATLYAMLYQQGLGLLSYNCLDTMGSAIYAFTSDRQFVSVSSQGVSEYGFAIGDQLDANFDPTTSYVAAIISGTKDKAIFVGDGSSNWYRCNPNQAPEGGPSWSPKATITGGFTAIAAVETSAGRYQLLIGTSTGTVLYRDLTSFSDNGTPYSAFVTIGSLVLSQPGQLAFVDSITTELENVGTIPTVGVLLEEIRGSFETLSNPVNDPPYLSAPSSLISKRFYLTRGSNPVICRHLQIKLTFATEAQKNELLTLSVYGALEQQE